MTNVSSIKEFGHAVRRRREALGWTLEQLSERAELTPNYIGSIENGKRDPSLSSVLSLAKGLGVKPAELFGNVPVLSAQAVAMGRLFDEVPEELQEAILMVLRALKTKKHR